MRRLPASVISCLAFSLVAWAVPARLPYEPPPASVLPAPVAIDLRGTHWTGWCDGIKANWTVYFEPSGALTYSYNGATYRHGSWTLHGNRLYFEMNRKYRECVCIANNHALVGESWNVTGLRWKTLLHPYAPPK